MTVTTEEKEDTIIFVLTGNGQPPEKDTVGSGSVHENTIRETGGLASLRTLVENAGGTMEIKAEEDFTVIIKMKNGS